MGVLTKNLIVLSFFLPAPPLLSLVLTRTTFFDLAAAIVENQQFCMLKSVVTGNVTQGRMPQPLETRKTPRPQSRASRFPRSHPLHNSSSLAESTIVAQLPSRPIVRHPSAPPLKTVIPARPLARSSPPNAPTGGSLKKASKSTLSRGARGKYTRKDE